MPSPSSTPQIFVRFFLLQFFDCDRVVDLNIASTGKSTSFEGGFSTLFKAKLHLNVTAECLHNHEEALLLTIILGEGFQVVHIEKMIQLSVLGHISISAFVEHQTKGSQRNTEKQR